MTERASSGPPLIAFICMALGATGMTLGDFFIKKASLAGVSVATLLVFAAPLTLVSLVLLSHLKGGVRHHLEPRSPSKLLIRALLLLLMSWLNITSLSLNPYAQHAMLFQMSPVFVVIIGAVFMKERLTTGVLLALLIGLCGTWLILNPGLKGIAPTLLIAIAAALSNATTNSFIAANRQAATPLGFTFWAVLGASVFALIFWLLFERTIPPLSAQIWIQLSAAFSVSGIILAGTAMQMANGHTGKVGIMLYIQMPVALLLGWLVFGEKPAALALLGGAMIALAGMAISLMGLRNRAGGRA